jgi:hypothetical protein
MREKLVNEVVALLAPLKPVAQVEHCPDRPSKDNFRHGKSAIFVGYYSSRADEPHSHGAQDAVLQFDIALLLRNVHGPQGAASMIDAIQEILVGKRLSLGGRLYWASDRFGAYKDGIWRYDIVVACKVPLLAKDPPADRNAEPPELGPALKYALTQHDSGHSTEVGTNPDA